LGKIRPKSRNEICFSTMTYLFYDDLSMSAIQAGPSGSRPLVGNSGGNSGTADSTTKAGGELIRFKNLL
jgi:hypothetical protein